MSKRTANVFFLGNMCALHFYCCCCCYYYYYYIIIIYFLILSQTWDREKVLRPHEELNLHTESNGLGLDSLRKLRTFTLSHAC